MSKALLGQEKSNSRIWGKFMTTEKLQFWMTWKGERGTML